MTNNLKKYILTVLLNKNEEDINEDKYAYVIAALTTDIYVDDICSYIMRSTENYFVKNKIIPSDTNILNKLTTAYCVERAYEYLEYLKNAHEPSHECEMETFVR